MDNPTGHLLLDLLVGVGEGPPQLVQHVLLHIRQEEMPLTIMAKETDIPEMWIRIRSDPYYFAGCGPVLYKKNLHITIANSYFNVVQFVANNIRTISSEKLLSLASLQSYFAHLSFVNH